jgi:type II secretory pathway pseudopilin PulG
VVQHWVMSATTPLWVPLTIAAVGIAGTLGAPVLAKWQERKDRRQQWQREDALRWQQDRQQAYARLIAALYAWDDELRSARASRDVAAYLNERSELDTAELRRLRTAAREARSVVDFMASDTVRSLASSALTDREAFRVAHLTGDAPADTAKTDAEWTRVRNRTVSLRDAMRADLGLQTMPEAAKQEGRRWFRPWRRG